MSIQPISYLKSRFACGMKPTQKDFSDLIDTLGGTDFCNDIVLLSTIQACSANGITLTGSMYITSALSAADARFTGLTASNGLFDTLNVSQLSATNAFFTSLTALSTVTNVIDIKIYELSGFRVTGDVDISGNVTLTGSITAGCGTSEQWCSTYTTVCANSAEWGSVYTTVCANSATWESTYTTVCAMSGIWDSLPCIMVTSVTAAPDPSMTYDIMAVGGYHAKSDTPPEDWSNATAPFFGYYVYLTNNQVASGLSGSQTVTVSTPYLSGSSGYNLFVEVVQTLSATHFTETLTGDIGGFPYALTGVVYTYPPSGTINRHVWRTQDHWGYENAVLYTDLNCTGIMTYPASSCLCATGNGSNIVITLPAAPLITGYKVECIPLTAIAESAYTTLYANSATWESTYTTVEANSASWDLIHAISANFVVTNLTATNLSALNVQTYNLTGINNWFTNENVVNSNITSLTTVNLSGRQVQTYNLTANNITFNTTTYTGIVTAMGTYLTLTVNGSAVAIPMYGYL